MSRSWYERLKVDEFAIHARILDGLLADVDHGAPGNDGAGGAFHDDVGFLKRDGIVVFGNLTVWVVVPRRYVVRVAVEWTTVAPLWFKENHGVVALNGAGEQAFGVARFEQ